MEKDYLDARWLITRYTRIWAVLTVSGAFVLGAALVVISYAVMPLPTDLSQAFRAIGESVIASLIIYVLIALFLDPRRQQMQTARVAGYAISEANRQFQEKFQVSLPTASYVSSSIPKLGFRENFVTLLEASSRYDHFGTTAHFATFRLAVASRRPEITALDQIRLSILDPRVDQTIRAHCELRLTDSEDEAIAESVLNEVARLKQEVHISLIALYDIRSTVSTSVYLHANLPFFRCEMFDDGMFLTYYLGGAPFPETLEFSATTRPYRAYKSAMILARRFATKVIRFGNEGPSADLINDDNTLQALLSDLDCNIPLSELRSMRDARFADLSNRLAAGGIDKKELF